MCVYNTQQLIYLTVFVGFPGGAVVKNPPANEGVTEDVGSTPGSGRSPGRGNGNPLQYSCLENAMDRGAWQVTVHGVTKKSDMTEHTLLRHQGRTIEYDCNLISRHKINSSVPC